MERGREEMWVGGKLERDNVDTGGLETDSEGFLIFY
jgi:hypothetical protein